MPALQLPRFRISLRTLIIGTLLVGALSGWIIRQLQHIEQRQELLTKAIYAGPCDSIVLTVPDVPFYRRWLGDREVRCLVVEERDFETAKRLFPEAMMIVPALPADFMLSPNRP